LDVLRHDRFRCVDGMAESSMKRVMLLSLLLVCQLRADPTPTPTPTPTPATKVYVKSDSTEWIPNCGFRISYSKGNDDYVVDAKVR
jgi:hypothetical protein